MTICNLNFVDLPDPTGLRINSRLRLGYWRDLLCHWLATKAAEVWPTSSLER